LTETETTTPLRYRGQSGNTYTDVAIRNEEHLGIAVQYAPHPSNVGCFIVRFVVHGKGVDPKNYKHLTYREPARFVIPATKTDSTEVFKGIRLNKVAIPVFSPAINHYEVALFAEKLGAWAPLAAWIGEQIAAEGFTLTVPNLRATIRAMFAPSTGNITLAYVFPDLAAPEEQKAALKLVQKPEPDEESDDDGDEEDKDDDPEWLN